MMKLRNVEVDIKSMLLAGIADRLSVIAWGLGGGKTSERPPMIADSFITREDKSSSDKFTSGEEFMKAWQGK